MDPGFDYVTDPIITITGGNGSGANAYANTKSITHSVSFYSTSDNIQVGLSSDTIGFSTFHRFKESERVIYKTDGQTAVCLLYTSPSPRDATLSRMPSSA